MTSVFPADEPFLKDVDNACNYRVLLHLALEATRGSAHPVLQLGLGEGSTPTLHARCERDQRQFVSFEEDLLKVLEYRGRFQSARHEIACVAFDATPIEQRRWSVALVDHAPGDRRAKDVLRLAARAEIVVVHDTEPGAEHAYHFAQCWPYYRSKVDVHLADRSAGAWSSAASATRDLSSWRGLAFGPFVIVGEGDGDQRDRFGERLERFYGEAAARREEELG